MKRSLALVAFLGVAVLTAAQQTNYIQGMAPNWDQPYDYPDAYDGTGPGPDPNPNGPSPWDAWCTPTAASMMLGYLEDYRGYNGLADTSADPNQAIANGYGGPLWANIQNWRLWHDFNADGSALRGARNVNDLGWYMDTNNLGMNWGNGAHAGTFYKDVAPGLNAYFVAMGGVAATMNATTYGVNPIFGGYALNQLLLMIQNRIDNNRTVIAHFSMWNLVGPGGPGQGAPGNVKESDFGYSDYQWGQTQNSGLHGEDWNGQSGEEGLGHSVTVVGYTVLNGAVTHLVVHDNTPLTVRNVRVPVGGNFQQLVGFTDAVPEPSALAALVVGLGLLCKKRNRG